MKKTIPDLVSVVLVNFRGAEDTIEAIRGLRELDWPRHLLEIIVVENGSGRVVGSSRYYEWNPVVPDVAIGYSFLSRDLWGTGANARMKSLMLAHAFRWVPTVWFHVARTNLRSRRAMEKLGAAYSHEELKELQGEPTPYVFYRIDAPG